LEGEGIFDVARSMDLDKARKDSAINNNLEVTGVARKWKARDFKKGEYLKAARTTNAALSSSSPNF